MHSLILIFAAFLVSSPALAGDVTIQFTGADATALKGLQINTRDIQAECKTHIIVVAPARYSRFNPRASTPEITRYEDQCVFKFNGTTLANYENAMPDSPETVAFISGPSQSAILAEVTAYIAKAGKTERQHLRSDGEVQLRITHSLKQHPLTIECFEYTVETRRNRCSFSLIRRAL